MRTEFVSTRNPRAVQGCVGGATAASAALMITMVLGGAGCGVEPPAETEAVAQELAATSDVAVEAGVVTYRIAADGVDHRVDLLDADGTSMGTLWASIGEVPVVVRLASLGYALDHESGALSFAQLDSAGSPQEWLAVAIEAEGFVGPGAELAAANSDHLKLMAAIVEELSLDAPIHSPAAEVSEAAEGDVGSTTAALGPACGSTLRRGSATGNTRSYCCQLATQNMNNKCWNSQCTGCCNVLDCDAMCALDDYFCSCGRAGYECAVPAPSCSTSWSTCSGYTNTCDSTGTQYCTGNPSVTRACSRPTNGKSCGTTTTTYGSCGYSSTCDESATKSATRNEYFCAQNLCERRTTALSPVACSRDTDGNSCGSTTTSYGTCSSFSSTCDETGTKKKTTTQRRCSSGGCSSTSSSANVSCTRDTDGDGCSDGNSCTQPDRCSSGSCRGGPNTCGPQ